MLGDFIKGNKYTDYPLPIQNGMLYHRLIDEYTDKHESIRAANKIIRDEGIKYAGVFIDIFFDHFIANDTDNFANNQELEDFTLTVLNQLEKSQHLMTEKMKTYFGYMIRYNWLYHYGSKTGIEKSIIGLVKRYPRLGDANEILFSLFNNIELLRPHYETFIADAKIWSKVTLKKFS
jgi:acyl carrier protein phosphodiesterase